MEMNLSPSQVAQNYAQVGAGKATRPTSHLIVLGILAGVLIALGGAATNTAVCGVDNAGIAKTICAYLGVDASTLDGQSAWDEIRC